MKGSEEGKMYVSILTKPVSDLGAVEKLELPNLNDKQLVPIMTEVVMTSAWCPGVFSGGRRRNIDCLFSDIIALDIDGDFPLDDACRIFQGAKHIIATTKSHQKEKESDPIPRDRFRVVLFPRKQIVSVGDYKHTVKKIVSSLEPFQVDPASMKISQFFFKCKELISTNTGGRLVQTFTAPPEKPFRPFKRLKKKVNIAMLSAKARKFILFGAKNGTFNETLFAISCELYSKGWTKEEIEDVVARVGHKGYADAQDKSTIQSAINTIEAA